MIKVHNISKKIHNKTILDNINLEIKDGEVFSLIGPNGAGKTTLVRILLNLYMPTSGKVFINNIDNTSEAFEEEKHRIGFLLDNIGLFKGYTAWDNIEFFDRIYNAKDSKEARANRITDLLNKVRLYEHRKEKVTFFSRGMKQRLALARALVNTPKLLILDEPLRGLDLEGQILVREIISDMKKKGCTIFINSHNLDEIQRITDNIAFINNGKIIDSGRTSTLLRKYNSINLEELYSKLIGFEKVE